MLAAENPSVDGHLAASTPRRRGMDRKPSKNANKKFIQARLPFKRLNSEPKENHPHKRPCKHAYPEPSDRENENESSPLPRQPLVNGRGPLDGFLSQRCSTASNKNTVIDLTEDNNLSPVKHLISPAPPSPCLLTKDKQHSKDKTASSEKSSNLDQTQTPTVDCAVVNSDDDDDEEEEEADDEDGNQTSISQLDLTQDSDSEPEEQNESGNVSSLGNKSVQSASSVSSMSESSPEKSKSEDPTPTTTPTEPKTTPKIPDDQKKMRRISLKSLQEQEERLRLRQEKECQKEEAKAAKEKKKEEARKLKEEREREKREKREKDEREKRERKEKEEKEKADKLKAKEELRKSKLEAKLEEKRKREEDKRMKEEEKRLKEEKDRLKAGKAEITRFLQIAKIQQAPKTLAPACGKFAPFEIKGHMSLAPLCRVQCADSVLEDLDRCLLNPSNNLNGLKDWIGQKPRQSGPSKRRRTDALGESIILDGPKPEGVPDRKRYGPMKLLRFHENYRPAYWGTWSKKSTQISPRCPLKQDKDLLDYEVDSDEEWEEEEPGESLSHSEGEDEEEGGEDDDDNDGFYVPHGYLSDDEVALEEESGDQENQKLRQKLKAREWDELMSTKKKMKVLEPVVRGCTWEGEGPGLELLQAYAVCLVEPLPKADTSLSAEELSQKCQREAQLLSQLLPLLHGNVNSSKVIITEYQEFCRRQTSSSSSSSPPKPSSPQSSTENIPTRIHVKRLIKSNAVYEKRSTHRRCCWYVHTEVLSRLGQEALPLPCQWTYLTAGAREESRDEPQAATGSQGNSPTTPQTSSTTPSSNKRKSTGSMSITKFMKRCTDPEQMEADGFQADTEEDDEEDCVIISTQTGPNREKSSSDGDVLMEVTPSDAAALPLASAAPALATA